jgi:hypothetical protein
VRMVPAMDSRLRGNDKRMDGWGIAKIIFQQ